VLNEERVKHGKGVYQWKKPGEDGADPIVKASYEVRPLARRRG
jgi:hypothetical protein